jgi:hypothetical protein
MIIGLTQPSISNSRTDNERGELKFAPFDQICHTQEQKDQAFRLFRPRTTDNQPKNAEPNIQNAAGTGTAETADS